MSFLLSLARLIIKLYIGLYVFMHAAVYFNPKLTSYLVFQKDVRWPFSTLNKPTEYGLDNVYNFYLDTDAGVTVGIWHYVPKQLAYDLKKDSRQSLKDHMNKFVKPNLQTPIIIYVHGNDRDRATPFRIELCKNLVNMGYHVFAIDYRGYGDSTGEPTEKGVVNDVQRLYELILHYNQMAGIYLYGHSLGTGIVCHLGKKIANNHQKLNGIILEAPFLNASLASKDYWLSLALNNNKWIQSKIDQALEDLDIHFSNDKNILEIPTKMIIFHAEDDWFVPHSHSVKLHEISKTRPKHFPEVKFVSFNKEHRLGHFLQSHPSVYEHIKKFIAS